MRAGRGVHVVLGTDLTDPDVRTEVAVAAAPSAVTLGGWAAARLHERLATNHRGREQGAALVFDGLTQGPGSWGPDPVLLLAPPEVRLTPGPGRRLVRSRVDAGERVDIAGLTVTSPLRTAFDIARLSTEADAVVGLDRLRALGLVDGGELRDLLTQRRGWRGVRAARRVLDLSADRVESPQESRLRLLWLAAGLPEPQCNPVVVDRTGAFVARVDVLDPSSGLVGEYDGAVHSSAANRSADAERQERLESIGLVVVRATAVDLATHRARAGWQARARAAHQRALARRPTAEWKVLPDTRGQFGRNSPLGGTRRAASRA